MLVSYAGINPIRFHGFHFAVQITPILWWNIANFVVSARRRSDKSQQYRRKSTQVK